MAAVTVLRSLWERKICEMMNDATRATNEVGAENGMVVVGRRKQVRGRGKGDIYNETYE